MISHSHTMSSNGFAVDMRHQRGIVLFIAMIALVVMSLAAVALIRSVDTNSAITGNLSFKQTASISSSYGIESMADRLGVLPTTNSEASNAADGYYATCTTFDTTPVNLSCDGTNLTAEATWQIPGPSRIADGVGITGGVDAYGNTVQYIVERMCTATGPSNVEGCLLTSSNANNNSNNIKTAPLCCPPEGLVFLPIYRVTVRVSGPKNTVSYIQSFIS